MKLARFLLLTLALLFVPALAHASGEDATIANRHTVYWAPVQIAGKQPIILFSHAFLSCGRQLTFLAEALAADGYWVFAPDHDDKGCAADVKIESQKSFNKPETWDDTTYADRAKNLSDLLDALKKDPKFSSRIDFSRLGLMGHSVGGYTVMGLAGAWPKWKMNGVKAVVAFSPYIQPFNIHQTLGGISAPIMYQGGSRDEVNSVAIKKSGGSFAQTPTPKYYIELNGADHFAWDESKRPFRDTIIAYSLAFFDHYVKGQPASLDLSLPRSDVSMFWYDSDLGKKEK